MYAGKPIRCLVNPRLGHECETVPAAVAAKRIVVIGGGVAGLAAAAISSERGHDVILLEEAPALGREHASGIVPTRQRPYCRYGSFMGGCARKKRASRCVLA